MARRVVYVPIGVSNECPLQSLDGQEREIPRVLANRHRLGGQLQLKKFRVWNYKSFFDSRELELGSGFNVLVGQNNSGKTALLEALQPNQLRDKPHRSFETAPSRWDATPGNSRVEFRFSATAEELKRVMRRTPFSIHPDEREHPTVSMPKLLALPKLDIDWDSTGGWRNRGLGLWKAIAPTVAMTWDGKAFSVLEGNVTTLGALLLSDFVSAVYRFDAERFNAGACAFGNSQVLTPNAGNLAEVLNVLQGNPVEFEHYNDLVRRVFPGLVERVTVDPVAGNRIRILIWNDVRHPDRIDLAKPLSESGTGVGQVLAILYVVYTAPSSRVLLIDEPNSFLHPAAARGLIEILGEHHLHQYIISTHSPDIVVAARPSTVHILRMKEGQTKVERVDAESAEASRAVLREVGSRLSDVFGADNVLWVEGQTEEASFPRIIRKFIKPQAVGLAIVGVLQTGDFEGPDALDVVRIYNRLSRGGALIPPAIAFVFDHDGRSDKEIEDAERLGGVHFLARRAFENYLLNAAAIAHCMNCHPPFSTNEAPKVTVDRVRDWIATHQLDPVYGTDGKTSDLVVLYAPKLLHDLFLGISENRLEYRKTTHSVELTEWILENKPDELKEVADLLRIILARSPPKER